MKRFAFVKQFICAACALVAVGQFDYSIARAGFTDVSTTLFVGSPNGLNLVARSASLADIDGDGDLDLFFQGEGSDQRLYRNNIVGDGSTTFTDVSSMLPAGIASSWSAAWSDYNGDGRVDVFVGQSNNTASAAGDLLKNNGASFSNESATNGVLNDPGFHQNVAWADIDNNGRLDLLIGMEGPIEKHEIYLQDALGNFSPVGAAAGFQAPYGTKAYGMAIGDTDGDGDLDVYISTCIAGGGIRNNFFKNNLVESGTNTLSFVDIADMNGTQFTANSYGAEFIDLDDDGDLDLFMVGADGQRSKIFRNDGGNMFTDVDSLPIRMGQPLLTDTGGDFNGGKAVDYDNDGDLDLFFHDNHAAGVKDYSRKLYRNDGNWQFTDVTAAQGISQTNRGAFDSVWGDIDLDGDQDLIAPTGTVQGNSNFIERAFRNDASTNGNHWLYVRLAGPSENTTGLGSSLYATFNEDTPQERTLRREANTNAGTFNQSDLPVHFGLGAAGTIDQLRIEWPDGSSQSLFNVAVDRYLTVHYLPGDYSGDGVVDAADYIHWRKGLGTIYSPADYTVWRAHFGTSLPASGLGAGTVPEPASAWPILAAVLGVVGLVRRR